MPEPARFVKETEDTALVAAYRAGDDAAFGRIFARHHAALLRYAQRMIQSESLAEDVVQEAMLRASRALRRDERHMELKPWLYRLVRNCALDELSRVRTDSVELDLADAAGGLRAAAVTEPEEATERRGHLRDVLGDVALLPAPQRHALLRREVDGVSVAQLSNELGVTEQAVKSLVYRARANLVKQREARSTTCADVQRDLLRAHDERRRASAASYRHLTGCGDCRAMRSALKVTRKQMAIMNPGPLLLAGGGLAGLAAAVKLSGGAASASVPTKAAAVAASAAVAAGAVGVGVQVFGPGDPAPRELASIALPGGALKAGAPLPAGTVLVTHGVEIAEGRTAPREVTLTCPPGTRVADLVPAQGGVRLATTYAPSTVVGVSTKAQVAIQQRPVAQATTLQVAILCRRPDAAGSLVPETGARAAASDGDAAAAARTVTAETYLLAKPSGDAVGSVRAGQPVTVLEARDGWRRVETNAGARGWIPADALR